MDKAFERFISPRKRIAMGDPDPFGTTNFGVGSLDSKVKEGPKPASGRYLADHERSAGLPIDGNQANPDHGDV